MMDIAEDIGGGTCAHAFLDKKRLTDIEIGLYWVCLLWQHVLHAFVRGGIAFRDDRATHVLFFGPHRHAGVWVPAVHGAQFGMA
jgi:hypothetical protein